MEYKLFKKIWQLINNELWVSRVFRLIFFFLFYGIICQTGRCFLRSRFRLLKSAKRRFCILLSRFAKFRLSFVVKFSSLYIIPL